MTGITHTKVVTKPQNSAFEVSKDEWNDTHAIADLTIGLAKLVQEVQDLINDALNITTHDTPDRHTLGTVVDHDDLAYLNSKAHGALTDVGADDHHPSGNIRDSVLGLKTGIKAGTGITITDDSGYAKIASGDGGGGVDFSNYRHYGTTQYEAWYTFPGTGTTGGALTLVANTLYAIPFVCPKAITLDRIGINVTTLKAGLSRLGIYADAGGVRTCYPGVLLLDAGTVDTSTVGVKSITINQALSSNTLYWLVIVSNVAPIITGIASASTINMLGRTATLLLQHCGLSVAFTYAPLPATFPTTTTTMLTSAVPAIFVRLSA